MSQNTYWYRVYRKLLFFWLPPSASHLRSDLMSLFLWHSDANSITVLPHHAGLLSPFSIRHGACALARHSPLHVSLFLICFFITLWLEAVSASGKTRAAPESPRGDINCPLRKVGPTLTNFPFSPFCPLPCYVSSQLMLFQEFSIPHAI